MTDNDLTEHGSTATGTPDGASAEGATEEVKPVLVFGQFDVQLDPNGRINVPKRLHPAFTAVGFLSESLDTDALVFWVKDAWDVMRTRLAKVPFNDLRRIKVARFFGTGAEVAMDGQKRLTIPPSLRGHLPSDRVTLVAMGSRVEIWTVDAWKAYTAQTFTPTEIGDALDAFAALDLDADA